MIYKVEEGTNYSAGYTAQCTHKKGTFQNNYTVYLENH